jgi:hypothetical protein
LVELLGLLLHLGLDPPLEVVLQRVRVRVRAELVRLISMHGTMYAMMAETIKLYTRNTQL